MDVFVTGGGGFLGQELVSKLLENGCSVTYPRSRDCNLFDPDALEKFAHTKFDRIFHLAAWTQAGDFCLLHPGEQWINNQKINTNVLTWWQAHQPQAKLIFMGTSCAYPIDMELRERNYMSGEPIDSLYTYAMTKRMLFQGARSIEKQFGQTWLCAVPSTLYGPRYHLDGRQMHFIFDLVRKILRGKLLGDRVVLWGDGHQRRELVHVRSFVDILLNLTENVDNKLLNIGAGEDYSIRDFVKIICEEINFDETHIEYDTTRYVGAKAKMLEISEIENEILDYKSSLIPLREGLKETIDWFIAEKAYLGVDERSI
ncbi:MAG: NAD-dependent epimerase/dehydratase family protein [Rhodobacteraceae bacterium]|nr:NAD-dependent epimerase/dehydratase family protein [Paracoccaceae bacterium]